MLKRGIDPVGGLDSLGRSGILFVRPSVGLARRGASVVVCATTRRLFDKLVIRLSFPAIPPRYRKETTDRARD